MKYEPFQWISLCVPVYSPYPTAVGTKIYLIVLNGWSAAKSDFTGVIFKTASPILGIKDIHDAAL
jgi:hypothetical protein